ncbi:hypothetical protein [Nocardia arthritidis]|uniref:hypothetical protein n=1 Tax=Nocardia arthritidis TaxID=228602 RepID=UPI0007A549AB|nr:hypothetical protein [Nocardia arthritidis]
MAIPASMPSSFDKAGTGVPPAARSSRSATADPARSPRGFDEQLAPLRIPALVVGTLMICLGLVALLPLRAWLHDYGPWLVIAAYLQYLGIAAALAIWGLRMTARGGRAR